MTLMVMRSRNITAHDIIAIRYSGRSFNFLFDIRKYRASNKARPIIITLPGIMKIASPAVTPMNTYLK